MFKTYYALTKPGIIYGNAVTGAAGFFLASRGHVNWGLFAATIVGMSLVMASACVANNYIDRDIDKVMERTKQRALPVGLISIRNAVTFAVALGLIGFLLLALYVNFLVVALGFIALITYLVLYGLAKRRSIHGTLVGSIAGALPPVAGYCAVTNHIDGAALILFLILVFWQMPHFYAIATYRLSDYMAAGLPVLPAVKGARRTKIEILIYIAAFTAAASALTFFGYTGEVYLVAVAIFGLAWLGLSIKGFNAKDDKRWARTMFLFSLIVIMVFSLMASVGSVIG